VETVRANDVTPLPASAGSPLEEELQEARGDAVDALLEAEEREAEARKARRRATSRLRHYEALLLEHGGQLTLPWEERSDS